MDMQPRLDYRAIVQGVGQAMSSLDNLTDQTSSRTC